MQAKNAISDERRKISRILQSFCVGVGQNKGAEHEEEIDSKVGVPKGAISTEPTATMKDHNAYCCHSSKPIENYIMVPRVGQVPHERSL